MTRDFQTEIQQFNSTVQALHDVGCTSFQSKDFARKRTRRISRIRNRIMNRR